MHIHLSEEQDSRLLAWIGPMTAAEVFSGVEPTGYTIEILVSPDFGVLGTARKGEARLSLGDIELTLSDRWKIAGDASFDHT